VYFSATHDGQCFFLFTFQPAHFNQQKLQIIS
jgi:hypothetical protein